MKYAELHVHLKSLLDADNDPAAFCDKLNEFGAKGFALTDHGSLAGIETVRRVAALKGLKMIPGVEAYVFNENDVVKDRHMILLSMDDTGYHAISMAVTDSNKNLSSSGIPRMTNEILEKYFKEGAIGHGHVIMMTACMNGVLAKLLLANDTVDYDIAILKRRQDKYGLAPDKNYDALKKKVSEASDLLEKAKSERNTLKSFAEMRYAKREKLVEKLRIAEDPSYEAMKAELDTDKLRSEDAIEKLPAAKANVTKLSKVLSSLTKELKEYDSKIIAYYNYENQIDNLMAKRKSKKELLDGAESELLYMIDIFGKENVYMEVQYHGIPQEKEIFPKLAELARKHSIPLVATNDVHTITKSEDEILKRAIIRSMRMGERFEEPTAADRELYLKTDEELSSALSKILPADMVKEAILNIATVFDRCNVEFKHENHYPKFPISDGRTTEEVFDAEIKKGITWRFPEGMDDEHVKRLNHEIAVIKSMGYTDYHLIVKDFLEYGRTLAPVPYDRLPEAPLEIEACKAWVKENGWVGGFSIGPGRGSAVGSLVCFILGITNIDPLKYDLMFERFLNPERVSMPDIDSDIAYFVREQAIRYIQHRYGENAVCGILTMNGQAPKGAIRIAAKYYGLKTQNDAKAYASLGDSLAKSVPSEVGIAFDSKQDNGNTVYENLCTAQNGNKAGIEILRWSKIMEGACTVYGAHAAGLVISDNSDVKEYIPLRWNSSLKEWTTQCDMVQTEEAGLLKMDLLGLRTLNIITDCIKSIYKRTGILIDPLRDIPLDDEEVYREIFQKGRTNSIFQFESPSMKNMLKRFRPTCFEDLIILVSMFRPGPLQFIDGVIDVKNGAKPTYITPELEPILSKTYGAIVYQEQVMEICQKLAGYSLGGADQVRRYMSKKKVAKMEQERKTFLYGDAERNIAGCVANGVSEAAGNKIYDQMMEFAKYAFNKSHAAAYATNSYYTAWFKLHYSADFLASAMNWATQEKLAGLIGESYSFGVTIIPPDINRSEEKFVCCGENEILFGLSGIKTVASNAEMIVKCRKTGGRYVSISEFLSRTSTKKNVVANLMRAGAFDSFSSNRSAMVSVIEPLKDALKKISDKENILATETNEKRLENAKKALAAAKSTLSDIVVPVFVENREERMAQEKELLGAYITESPLDQYPAPDKVGCTAIGDFTTSTTKIFGIIENLEIKYRKKDNRPMAFFELTDKTGSIKVAVFTKQYAKIAPFLKEDAVIALSGSVNENETSMLDENGVPIVEYVFYAEYAQYVPKELSLYYMDVSSYPVFHLTQEEAFKRDFACMEGGHKLIIHDKALDEMREATFRVSETAKLRGVVKEL